MTFRKTAATAVPIHPHLAERWSPRGFNAEHTLEGDDLTALLEAARWTPSASNSQPWRFIVGRRGDATFAAVEESLAPGNRVWAQHASALLVACAVVRLDDGKEQRWAEYDTGQAVATLSMQAMELGLHVHQMAGFNVDGIRRAFDLPEQLTPITVVAIGKLDPEADLPEGLAERERAPRQRLSVAELLITDPRKAR